MTIGGYKFAGYNCLKGAQTDLEWVLHIHRTRVKAFYESNAATNSGWAFDPSFTSGMYTFESSGNVVYSLDDLGYNLVSFFKHGAGDAYFAIVTSTYREYYDSLASGCKGMDNSDYNQVPGSLLFGVSCSVFCIMSLNQITPSNCTSKNAGSTNMFPVGKMLYGSNPNSAPTPNNWSGGTYPYCYYDHANFGFAMKGKNIICFSASDVYSASANYINACCFSAGGFASLCDAGDPNNFFAMNFQTSYNSDSAEVTKDYPNTLDRYAFWCPNNSSGFTYANAMATELSYYNSLVQVFPFAGIVATDIENTTLHIMGKGITDPEFLAVGCPHYSMAAPTIYSTFANGNYLVMNQNTTDMTLGSLNNASTYVRPLIFCGWDPSNPDITTPDSWTNYPA